MYLQGLSFVLINPHPINKAHGEHKITLRDKPMVQVTQDTEYLGGRAGNVVWIHRMENVSWRKEFAVLLVGSGLPLRVFVPMVILETASKETALGGFCIKWPGEKQVEGFGIHYQEMVLRGLNHQISP